MKTRTLARGGIRETAIVSSCPGVTIRSETTRAFWNTTLSLPAEAAPAPITATRTTQTSALAATMTLPLPENTG